MFNLGSVSTPSQKTEENGKHIITSGFIAYYKSYIVEELGKEVPVCAELKEKYRATTAYLRKKTTRFKAGSRDYWIGGEAEDFLKTGGMTSVENFEMQKRKEEK